MSYINNILYGLHGCNFNLRTGTGLEIKKAAVRPPFENRIRDYPGPLPEGGPGDSAAVARRVFRYIAIALAPAALSFLAELHRSFNSRRMELLGARNERQRRFDAGELPDFLPETAHIRDDPSWRVAPAPADLDDRRVEITGPVEP